MLLLTTAIARPALAADAPGDDPADDIVVTANRSPSPRAETGQAVTVIDASTIRTRQTAVLTDLLRTTPGVTVTRNGTIGATTGLSVRGAESEQTLVLIDGVRINDPSSPGGGANLGPILTGNIRRIELLRGPNSVIWGSQAIGGVLSIETEPPGEAPALRVRAEGGYAATANLVGDWGLTSGPVALSGGGYYYRSDGISSFNRRRGGLERDGIESFAFNARGRATLADGLALDTRVYYVDADTGIDGGFPLQDTPERASTRQLTLYAGLDQSLLDGRLRQRAGFAYTDIDRGNRNPALDPATTFAAKGRLERYEYQATFDPVPAATLIAGVEHEDSRLRTVSPSPANPAPIPTRAATGITSVYGQAVLRPLAGVTLTGGLRHDSHDRFGSATTFGANAVLTPNRGATLLRGTYAEGFKAPTLFQLLSDFGNPDLAPERAHSFDIGLEQHALGDRVTLAATYFDRRTRNQIAFVSCFGSSAPLCLTRPNGTYDNIARTRANGVEIAASARPLAGLELSGQYSRIDTRNRSLGANFGRRLARRPADSASLSADYRSSIGLSGGITATLVGDSFDDAANRTRLDDYLLIDIRAAYALTDRIELYGRIENLAGDRYETIFGYGTYPRSAYAGVRARF